MIESLNHCRKKNGMEIYAYCIMPSHVHLIIRSAVGDPSVLMRDLKGIRSRKKMKATQDNP
jgi:putative transposase